MRTLTDDIVVRPANEKGFAAAQKALRSDGAVRAVLCGPAGCGKSTVLQARGRERDLLASKSAAYAHGQEIAAAINLDINEGFLEKVAEVDVLYFDGLNDLSADGGTGADIVRLLLAERDRRGLSTVAAFDGTEEQLRASVLGDALAGYELIAVGPLDDEGKEEFARRMAERFKASEDGPKLTDDALAYLARDFAEDAQSVRNAVRFLLASGRFAAGEEIDRADAQAALAS